MHSLIIDGHSSHKSPEAIDVARDHRITMITLPSHTTHMLQPLDATFFKALKANYNSAADNYTTSNAGKRIIFYEMADLLGKAYGKSASVEKAVRAFEHTGMAVSRCYTLIRKQMTHHDKETKR